MANTWRGKPMVTVVGTVEHVGETTVTRGWGLTYCLRGCRCHEHRITHRLDMVINDVDGSIGLRKYAVCTCCEPWTVAELDGFVKDAAAIAAMTTIEGLLS